MRRSVIISINPKWCEKIAAGQKQIEIRKNRPTYETPFKCYIYQTKKKWYCSALRLLGKEDLAEYLEENHGRVIGEFICRDIEPITPYGCLSTHYATPRTCKTNLIIKSGLYPESKLIDYLGYNKGFAWHIFDLVIYDKPKSLYDFIKPGRKSIGSLDEDLCKYCSDFDYGEKACYGTPDGPVMCEGASCDKAYQAYLDDEGFTLYRPPQSWCYVEEIE